MLVGIAREHKQAPRRQHQRAERLRLSAPPPSAALRGELKGGGGAEGDLLRVGAGGREVRVRVRVRVRARARVGVRVRVRARVRVRVRVRARARVRVGAAAAAEPSRDRIRVRSTFRSRVSV